MESGEDVCVRVVAALHARRYGEHNGQGGCCWPGARARMFTCLLSNANTQTYILQKFRPLISVCLDALYNLTCVSASYNGIERVIKSLLGCASLPQVQATSRSHVLQGICNGARFEPLRPRIIEDGALQILAAAANSLSKDTTDEQFVPCVAMSLRLLSDSKQCRRYRISRSCLMAPDGALSTATSSPKAGWIRSTSCCRTVTRKQCRK
jgi:hypothetical protein